MVGAPCELIGGGVAERREVAIDPATFGRAERNRMVVGSIHFEDQYMLHQSDECCCDQSIPFSETMCLKVSGARVLQQELS